MKSFREWLSEKELNEAEIYKVEYKDPMGNKEILSSNGKIVTDSGISIALSDLSYIVDKRDVTKETGNSGYKDYKEYLMKRIKEAASKSKNNELFAKELNKIFKVNMFKAV